MASDTLADTLVSTPSDVRYETEIRQTYVKELWQAALATI